MKIQILPLQGHHDTEAFTCGDDALDGWIRRTAKQHIRKGISRSFVAIEAGSSQNILGFYSLTVGEAETAGMPASVAKSLPRKIPIVLLGRLAVATSAQGQGIGGHLLVDALHRTVRVASEVGISAILVDAKNKSAETFYQHYGFQTLPDSPHRLVLPIKTAMDLFESLS
jgi:GNAT superfamily N-acetyltransferase